MIWLINRALCSHNCLNQHSLTHSLTHPILITLKHLCVYIGNEKCLIKTILSSLKVSIIALLGTHSHIPIQPQHALGNIIAQARGIIIIARVRGIIIKARVHGITTIARVHGIIIARNHGIIITRVQHGSRRAHHDGGSRRLHHCIQYQQVNGSIV
jgi:hypothetical protein